MIWLIALLVIVSFPGCSKKTSPTEPSTAGVQGTLTEFEGISILRIWGTPREQGYAHGYLIGEEIVTMLENFVKGGVMGLDADKWENEVIPAIGIFDIEERFVEELQGMLAGIEAKMGGEVNIPSLGRGLKYDDLAAINVGPDFYGMMCSSFAAWGTMTMDGNTIAGRNFDWNEIPGVFEKQFLIVYVSPAESQRLDFVTINWPGIIGCSTAMNSEGVTLNINNTNGYPPTQSSGFHPRILIYREAIESAHAESALNDVKEVLLGRITSTPQNLMITMPHSGTDPSSVVFEYDGNLLIDGGVSVREPDATDLFQICTNHCRVRKPPIACQRYSFLYTELGGIAADSGETYLSKKKAWELLDAVALSNPTHHRVIFEPNLKIMHVGLSVVNPNPQWNAVTFNISDLINGNIQNTN